MEGALEGALAGDETGWAVEGETGMTTSNALANPTCHDVRHNIGQTTLQHISLIVDIVLGRRSMSEYDALVKAWQTNGGETIRKEYAESIAASA